MDQCETWSLSDFRVLPFVCEQLLSHDRLVIRIRYDLLAIDHDIRLPCRVSTGQDGGGSSPQRSAEAKEL